MKTQKQLKSLLAPFALVLLTLFSLTSCDSNDDPVLPQGPTVDLTEVGSGNGKTANVGGDLHLNARIEAEGLIAKVAVEIHQEGGSYEMVKEWTEGKYIGVRNAEFHEHIDIAADAPAGDYHLHLTVTDGNGRTATATSELKVLAIQPSAELIFTEVSGDESLYAHGDHFHGLGGVVEGESVKVTFDGNGKALSNGHLHLDPHAIYKIELKTYDAQGNETQGQYIANKATADQYKAFLIGGNLKLNANSAENEGAIFQPRETTYTDGSPVNGQYETTGIVSYFTIGHENESLNDDITFVLRKLNEGVKATISRSDWNRSDYASAFAGENVLELKFEVHAEHDGHDHDH